MNQFQTSAEEQQTAFHPWCIGKTGVEGQSEYTLADEWRKLEEQKRKLELAQREFSRRVEVEDRRIEQQKQLFDMKFQILEEELKKLAIEKQLVAKQKEFFNKVRDFERKEPTAAPNNIVKGELFFTGVRNRQSLKKRYKDLIKIYHPDNIGGDKNTLQEINREYDHLSKLLVQ